LLNNNVDLKVFVMKPQQNFGSRKQTGSSFEASEQHLSPASNLLPITSNNMATFESSLACSEN
jgi:hypothetical protein